MNNNIYLDLELFLDPAITDAAALTDEIKKRIPVWSTDLQSQQKIAVAKTFLAHELFNLTQQAEDARNIKIQSLRNRLADLMIGGELQQFEIDYLKRNFTCFNEATIIQEISNYQPNIKSVQNYFLSTIKAFTKNVPAVIRNQWTKSSIISPIPNEYQLHFNGKKIIGIITLVVLFCVALYVFSCLPKKIGSGFSSYQRGIGEHINRYANHSYSNSQWEEIKNLPEDLYHNVLAVHGWDKTNFVIKYLNNNNGVGIAWFHNGNWQILESDNMIGDNRTRWHYNKPNQFILFLNHCLRIYEKESYKDINIEINNLFGFFQVEDDHFILTINNDSYYRYDHEKLTPLSQKDVENIFDDRFPLYNSFYHCYRNNEAIGINRNKDIVQYNNGQCSKLYSSTHSGDVAAFWATDENNFVIVGSDVTLSRDGKETHPIVTLFAQEPQTKPQDSLEIFSGAEKSFQKNATIAVWGTNIDHFWVMDNTGNIAEFNKGQAGKVVVEGLGDNIQNVWVSPEGIVFAVFDGKLYQLD